jgi:hypothetical protein
MPPAAKPATSCTGGSANCDAASLAANPAADDAASAGSTARKKRGETDFGYPLQDNQIAGQIGQNQAILFVARTVEFLGLLSTRLLIATRKSRCR